jgi:hypothetical protein
VRFLALVYWIMQFLALSLLYLNAFLSPQSSDRAFYNPISFRVHFPALSYHIMHFLALSLWALISLIVCFLALSSFPMSAPLSPHFLYNAFFSPISFCLYAFILDIVLSSPISFSSECAFRPSFQTLSEGLTIYWFGESVISYSFFFFTKLII